LYHQASSFSSGELKKIEEDVEEMKIKTLLEIIVAEQI
jgi:hypothetical protein